MAKREPCGMCGTPVGRVWRKTVAQFGSSRQTGGEEPGLQSVSAEGKRRKADSEPGQPRTNLFQIPTAIYLFIYLFPRSEKEREKERGEKTTGRVSPLIGALFGPGAVFFLLLLNILLTVADHRLVLRRLDAELGAQ